jgi:hypothetical protein
MSGPPHVRELVQGQPLGRRLQLQIEEITTDNTAMINRPPLMMVQLLSLAFEAAGYDIMALMGGYFEGFDTQLQW